MRIEQTTTFATTNVNADKCISIARQIGKIPVIALGNSTGDTEMLNWTQQNARYPSLELIVLHDDEVRERLYDVEKMCTLCGQNDWLCASMAMDFATVFDK